jgi:hypothetical protein
MKVERREDWIGKVAILVIQPESYVQISSEIPVEMVKEWGLEGVFVSANKPYSTIEESFRNFGILDKIIFVDCASSLAGDYPSGERIVLINNPADLTQLAISLTKSLERLGAKRFLVFDSLTTLLIYSKVGPLAQFAHSLGLMMKTRKVTCFFLAVDQEATKEMLGFLCTIADEYVHVDIDEGGQTFVV